MDPRSIAHILTQIGDLLELRGENRFKSSAYRAAARAVMALEIDDLRPLLDSGELATVSGIGPATLRVITELLESGDSSYYEQLREDTPEGLLEMMRVPGLGTAKIHTIYRGLGVDTLHELEAAARDGRLATLPRFGPKTAEKIIKGIAQLRETSPYVLYPHAVAEAQRLLASIRQHPGVERASVAGSLRRRCELVRDIDVVAACLQDPAAVAASFARAPSVRDVMGVGSRSVTLRFIDGTQLDLYCVEPREFGVAFWRATGGAVHEQEVRAYAAARGVHIGSGEVRDANGSVIPIADEHDLYAAAGLPFIEPELREGRGEVAAAARDALPSLVRGDDIRGVLHCHSQFSDGKATIAEMAAAARERGWHYLGISDHSQSAFYAGGLSRDAVLQQHEEIDRVNETMDDFVVLKGIEADILADGRVDYEPELLDRFDYVIASVHSRFSMDGSAMTARVLTALEDPHVTILGHPTGRLLLTREPYAIDMERVLERAAETGVAVELNADPHRLDLDWRLCQRAKELGVAIEIGPDAHSPHGLDNVEIGVGIARKGWLEAGDVLNAYTADEVLARAARRKAGA